MCRQADGSSDAGLRPEEGTSAPMPTTRYGLFLGTKHTAEAPVEAEGDAAHAVARRSDGESRALSPHVAPALPIVVRAAFARTPDRVGRRMRTRLTLTSSEGEVQGNPRNRVLGMGVVH